LDFVQWATDPAWGLLGDDVVGRMLVEDVPFLQAQLRASSIEMILLNGRRVITEFEHAFGLVLLPHGQPLMVDRVGAAFYAGTLADGVRVIGWSLNLQSSFGVTNNMRQQLAGRVGAIAGGR
jgi:hypothetical protein